jgi:hypothetical protein
MTRKQESTIFIVLTLAVMGLLAYLVYDAMTAYRGADIDSDVTIRPTPDNERQTGQSLASEVYRARDPFFPIVTPEPTPTREILPTPTPTPIPFAERWKIMAILGEWVQFTDESNKTYTKTVGDEHYGVLIREIHSDHIVVEYLKDGLGRTKELSKGGVK